MRRDDSPGALDRDGQLVFDGLSRPSVGAVEFDPDLVVDGGARDRSNERAASTARVR